MSHVILLVEDNPTDEKLTLRAFRSCPVPHEIIVARDGVEALDFLFGRGAWAGRDTSRQPAVVLLDVKLPRLDGLEVLRCIRADPGTQFLPVTVLTSSKEAEDLLRSYELGANAYVRKPVDFAEFVEAAKTLGILWLSLNERAPAQTAGDE